jgi:DNA-binding CsgD family transcriptional regulator
MTRIPEAPLTTEQQRQEAWLNEPLFHSYDELKNLKDLPWLIRRVAHVGETTALASLPKHSKTWTQLSIAYSLRTQKPLFGYEDFKVPERSRRIIYLIPEVGIRPFWRRIKLMKLEPFVKDSTMLIRSLSMPGRIELDDERLLKMTDGADVFIDTFIRYIDGDESSSSEIANNLATKVMGLLSRGQARSVWGAHHSPKEFEKARRMTMNNMIRGSGDISAFLSNAYGLRQLDKDKNLIHVECLGSRDIDQIVGPFQLTGFPFINDTGNFRMTSLPGKTGPLEEYIKTSNGGATGRKSNIDNEEMEILKMVADGKSYSEVADELTKKGRKTSKAAVGRLVSKMKVKGQVQIAEEEEPDGA